MEKFSTDAIVLRAHAGGHLVHCNDIDLLCAPRGRLKKERTSVVTGDKVEVGEIDTVARTGVIVKRYPRVNQLSRPVIANIDTPVIVQAAHQPEWNPLLCDRYLIRVQFELPGITPILCINKCDLAFKDEEEAICKIYKPLGFKLLFISASTGAGIDALSKLLSGKISVLIGPSGVGKSSITNLLDPDLRLRTGVMENEFGMGRSTTTYSALYPIKIGKSQRPSWVADTPGFSLSELRQGLPRELKLEFPEIVKLAPKCKYVDCLHLNEEGCGVLANLNRIAKSRYRSYTTMMTEALKRQKLESTQSKKQEQHVKVVGGKGQVPRLERKYRVESRRRLKQELSTVQTEEEE
jgi:ribosome biogenesis GTPase